jgi:threonine/homoserine/homoserine lactone efflux protein
MAIGAITGFWIVSLLLVMVPGADWAYAIAAGLRDRSVLPAVAGLLTGYVAVAAVVAAGVVYTGVGTAARRALRARPAIAVGVTRFSGAAMIIIGIFLLAERLLG